jgi:hypothetical protein
VAKRVLVRVLTGVSGLYGIVWSWNVLPGLGRIGLGYFRSNDKTRLLEFSREQEMGLLLNSIVLDQVLQIESLAADTQYAIAIA